MSYKVLLEENEVTVISKNGTPTSVTSDNPNYYRARNAALDGDWDEYYSLAKEVEEPAVMLMGMGIASSIPDMLNQISIMTGMDLSDLEDEGPSIQESVDVMKGLISDGLVDPEDLGLIDKPDVSEHDLSNWSGSPIYFDTEEAARDQADTWPMFWEYHDFGVGTDLPVKYRHACVPRLGMAPTAPEGYDWVCLKRS